jgi:hypothetical protein
MRAAFAVEHAGRQGHAGERDDVSNTGQKAREELSLHHQVPPATGRIAMHENPWKVPLAK